MSKDTETQRHKETTQPSCGSNPDLPDSKAQGLSYIHIQEPRQLGSWDSQDLNLQPSRHTETSSEPRDAHGEVRYLGACCWGPCCPRPQEVEAESSGRSGGTARWWGAGALQAGGMW